MKKVKIMLTSIAVLAIVGGAIAFKARNFGGTPVCIEANPSGAPGVCNSYATVTLDQGIQKKYYIVSGLNTTTCTQASSPACNVNDLIDVE
jgi:hypothetical protein